MLNLTIRKVDFNELKVEDIGKRPVLDTLLKFWNKSENEYIEFLQKHNIDFYKNFTSIAELKDTLKQDIETINNIAEQNLENAFDFKTINFLKSKNLKEINDYEFVKLTIDLRQINNAENKELIKDLFLETKSVSLVDFIDVSEHSCSLIYHKKGAFYYNNEPYMCNSRESLTLLENYEIPKDSNFILTRFLLDLSNKFEDNNIDESFCVQYSNGKENIANMHEVIYWGHLNAEEKREIKAEIKKQEAINNEAKQIAKEELKAESNATRDSLKPKEAYSEIDKKEETISKLRSTLQTKINEMKDFEYKLEQEYEEKIKEMNLKLNADNENLSKSLKELENKYAREKEQIEKKLESLDSQNDKIKEENYKLLTQNESLQSNLKEQRKELETLQQDFNDKLSLIETNTKEFYKLEGKMEAFNDREKHYKEQIQELKDKNQALETRLNNILDNTFSKQAEEKLPKKLRSKDILGDYN